MTTELRRKLRTALALGAMTVLAACGGGGGGGGAGEQPAEAEEQSVQGQVLVGVTAYPSPAAEAKIAAIGTVVQVNEQGGVYGVDLKPGLGLADAQAIVGGDVRYVEKNYLAHRYAAAADPGWAGVPGPQYNSTVKGEVEAAWTAAISKVTPATGAIDLTSAADGDTVVIAGVTFTAGASADFDLTSDGAAALVAAITGSSDPALAGLTAVASGKTLVNLSAPPPGGAAVTVATTGGIAATGLTGGKLTASRPITIAVIDSGVDCTHEDLADKCAAGRNVITNAAILATANSDDVGHGTEVAGVAAATTGNGKGIAGVAGAPQNATDPARVQIVPVKVSSASIPANHALIAKGIDWAVNTLNPPADVVLISLGSSTGSYTLQHAIEGAWAKGALVVAAAGNAGTNAARYPAAYQSAAQSVLAVGHVDATDAVTTDATGSGFGTWVNLLAPGTGVLTTTIGGDAYTTPAQTVGSSYGAAFVAGAAALVKSAYPTLTKDQLRNLLASSVETYGRTSGRAIAATGGRLDVEQAMALAATPAAKEVASVVLAAPATPGGKTVTGTVVLLNSSTQAVTVTLSSSDNTNAAVPATISIPAGKTSGTFTVTTKAVATGEVVHIKAGVTTGKEVTADLAVNAAGVTKLACTPTALLVNQTTTCTVTLDTPAPSAGLTVTVDTSNHTVATAKVASITLTGVTSGTFVVDGKATGTFKATAKIGSGATFPSADLTVSAGTLTVALTPASVASGGTVTGKLTFNGKVAADTTVHFVSDNTNLTAPADQVVKAGASSGTFTITAGTPDASATAHLTASITGGAVDTTITQAAAVTVQGIGIKSIDLGTAPYNVTASGPITGTVTLNSAPKGGAVDVPLSVNSDLCYVNVAKVTVAKDQTTSGSFTVSCIEPNAKTTVVLTAQPAGVAAKTATLNVLPTLLAIGTFGTDDTTVKTTLKAGEVVDVVVTLSSVQGADVPVGVSVKAATGSSASLPTLGGTDFAAAGSPPTGTVSGTLTVKATKSSGKFTVTGTGATGGSLVVTVSVGPVTLTKTLTYAAPALTALAASPTTLLMGGTTTVTATMEAASGATDVALTYSATGAFASPATKLTVSNGATSGTAVLTAVASGLTSAKSVTVSGTLGAVKKTTAAITVLPATFSSVAAPQAGFVVGANNAAVTLSSAQTLTCAVSTSQGFDTTVATVPTTVALTAAATANLVVTGVKAGDAGSVTVTCGGVAKTLAITVQ